MNYESIYQRLIERSKNRIITDYFEHHHIIPKCVGGTDLNDNIAKLTPEEHYLAHLLLVKMYPGNKKLIYAANMMCRGKNRSNKLYGWLRRLLSKESTGQGNPMFGRKYTNERKALSARFGPDNAFYGKHHSEETKEKIRNKNIGSPGLKGDKNGMYGKHHSEETKNKISMNNPWKGISGELNPNFGRKQSEEEKQMRRDIANRDPLSESRKQNMRKPKGPQKKLTCPHCGKEGGSSNMQRYHFDKCKFICT